MTIAEKITRAKADYDEVYEAGYEKGKSEGGGDNYYDIFWDNFQDNGKKTNYQYAFRSESWNDINFKPKYNIIPTTCSQMFQACNITDLEAALQKAGVTLDTSNSTTFLQMAQSSKITVLPKIDARKATSLNYAFAVNTIKVIRELVVSETTPFGNTFGAGLEEIRITGTIGQNGFLLGNVSNLTHDSIVSIINALSNSTSGLSVTFDERAVNKAFETAEGANDGSTSAEWLALVATRSNWTIALA